MAWAAWPAPGWKSPSAWAPRRGAELGPYLKHRRAGRPWVILKLAATVDGRTAARTGRAVDHRAPEPGPTSTGCGPRRRRAGWRRHVRADDPELTVRDADGPDPVRVVLGTPPETPGSSGAVAGRRPRPGARRLAERGVLPSSSRGAPRWPTFHAGRPGRPLRDLPRPRSWEAPTAPGCSRGPGAVTIDDAGGGGSSSTWPDVGDDSRPGASTARAKLPRSPHPWDHGRCRPRALSGWQPMVPRRATDRDGLIRRTAQARSRRGGATSPLAPTRTAPPATSTSPL